MAAVQISSVQASLRPQFSSSKPSQIPLRPTLSLRPNATTHASLNSTFLRPLRLLHHPTILLPRRRSIPSIQNSMEVGIGVMGTKLGMMTYFEPTGKVVPVTVVGFREGNIVTQVKTVETDGYNAVQVGYRTVRERKLTFPEKGHLDKSGIIALRHLQEFRLVNVDGFEPAQKLAVEELFKEGDLVDSGGGCGCGRWWWMWAVVVVDVGGGRWWSRV